MTYFFRVVLCLSVTGAVAVSLRWLLGKLGLLKNNWLYRIFMVLTMVCFAIPLVPMHFGRRLIEITDVSDLYLTERFDLFLRLDTDILWMAWLVGVIGFLLFTYRRHYNTSKALRTNTEYMDESLQEIADKICEELGIKSVPIIGAIVQTPIAAGVINRRVYLTWELLEGMDEEDLELILRHELHHHAANDLLKKHVLNVLLALHWFNPAIYWLFNQINLETEIRADAFAVKHLTAVGPTYFSELLTNAVRLSMAQPDVGSVKKIYSLPAQKALDILPFTRKSRGRYEHLKRVEALAKLELEGDAGRTEETNVPKRAIVASVAALAVIMLCSAFVFDLTAPRDYDIVIEDLWYTHASMVMIEEETDSLALVHEQYLFEIEPILGEIQFFDTPLRTIDARMIFEVINESEQEFELNVYMYDPLYCDDVEAWAVCFPLSNAMMGTVRDLGNVDAEIYIGVEVIKGDSPLQLQVN